MKCPKCNGIVFVIQTSYAGSTTVEMTDDGEDFEIIDSEHGDGEFVTDEMVSCDNCRHELTYKEWEGES